MIMNSFDKRTKPRLKKFCKNCGEKFTPKGLSRSEKLCEKCFDKARSSKGKRRGKDGKTK